MTFRRDDRGPGFRGPTEGRFCETNGYHAVGGPGGNFKRPAVGELLWHSEEGDEGGGRRTVHYFLCDYCLGYFFALASERNEWSVWPWEDDGYRRKAEADPPPLVTLDPPYMLRQRRSL